jgi:glycosyltransferase involved in cell wall biosynthesis
MKLGIYCPDWILAWHNTDHKVVKMFSRLDEFSSVRTSFIASKRYTLTYNFDKLAQKIVPLSNPLHQHGLRDSKRTSDVVYHYGSPVNPNSFYKTLDKSPVFVTTGFMTDQFVNHLFGKPMDRQVEADELAKSLEKAQMIHFHTFGGLQRFLHYRPEFKEKAVHIPFFLPNLRIEQTAATELQSVSTDIPILFVGSDGKRKGLPELIEALDILGKDYLQSFAVKITVVSKNKPQPRNGINLSWFKYLPHEEIMALMQQSPIFVLVPQMESYGLVLVEAMCNKCAIITDNDETRKEILGNTGLLIAPGSSKLLARSLRQLIENKKLREDLGQSAQERASMRFTPEIVSSQYIRSFQTLMNDESSCKP